MPDPGKWLVFNLNYYQYLYQVVERVVKPLVIQIDPVLNTPRVIPHREGGAGVCTHGPIA